MGINFTGDSFKPARGEAARTDPLARSRLGGLAGWIHLFQTFGGMDERKPNVTTVSPWRARQDEGIGSGGEGGLREDLAVDRVEE